MIWVWLWYSPPMERISYPMVYVPSGSTYLIYISCHVHWSWRLHGFCEAASPKPPCCQTVSGGPVQVNVLPPLSILDGRARCLYSAPLCTFFRCAVSLIDICAWTCRHQELSDLGCLPHFSTDDGHSIVLWNIGNMTKRRCTINNESIWMLEVG